MDKYRFPIDIEVFYEGFESNSYDGRRAMKNLLSYHKFRKSKAPLFLLNGKAESFE